MRKITVLLALSGLLTLAGFLGGCQTLSSDKEMQIRKYSRISDLNRRMLHEDVEAIMLLDRPSNLSRWHVRNSY